MHDLLRWTLSLIVTALVLLFAIANRADVPLVWSPVHKPIDVPLCAAVLGGAALGFLFGAVFVWLTGGPLRAEHRRHKKKVVELERQLGTVPEITHEKA